MFYSAEALKTIKDVQELLGRELTQRSLDAARTGGRTLVTDEDVWAALDDMGISHLVIQANQG